MAKIERTIAGDVTTEIAGQHTLPYYLVRMDFGSGTQYMSTGKQTTFDTNVYQEGAVRVGSFAWDADAGQRGNIFLLNELNSASAIVLNNQIADTPVRVYKTYDTGAGNTTPVEVVRGYLEAANISPVEVTLTVFTSGAHTNLVPNEFHNQDNGFNHLVAAGTVILWGGEKFLLEVD